jgi:ribonuclease PH
MLEDKVPQWRRGSGAMWISAEYGMLPGSTTPRQPREASRGKQSGRTLEIQRLIGRALRTVCDLEGTGEKTLWLDCDVLEADGGTRCTAINGAMVAAAIALDKHRLSGWLKKFPVRSLVAAISVGKVMGELLCDLNYVEDSGAEVDMNIIMTEDGRFVELQGTAERTPFSKAELDQLIALAMPALDSVFAAQREALRSIKEKIGG